MLFIPGNAGSYKQVRPVAAEAATYFYENLAVDVSALEAGVRNLDFFTVDFNEDITAFHGQTLLDQAEYLNEAVRFILSLYTDPDRAIRASDLPDPSSVIILGHSMGGIVARAMLIQPNYQSSSINTILTLSAPHARPPVTFDGQIVRIYDEINDYWRRAYTQKWANNNPLWHVTLVSIAGGSLDTVVPSDYASLESLVPETHGFTAFTTGIANVWTSMDHQAILWCDQFRKVVARALFDIVDVHRASQTKPRADRMRAFKRRFLTGMEPSVEKTLPMQEATTLLTLDDESNDIVPAGERLVLSSLGLHSKPKAHLLPIPPQGSPGFKRFTLLTDSRLDEAGQYGQLEVLFCSVVPSRARSISTLYPLNIDLSQTSKESTRLACKSAAIDTIPLPASTSSTKYPFYRDGEPEIAPFSYLQYDVDDLSEHHFVAVVDKATVETRSFVFAEFSDQTEYSMSHDIGLMELLLLGSSLKLPPNRPTTVEVNMPAVDSALLAYDLKLSAPPCSGKQELFAPLLRQYIARPYESRYFVNAREAGISLHGSAPYMPPPLMSHTDHGLTLQLWTDPTCDSQLEISLKVDILGSLGKLYMRYRTVFAAFPLLIVTLVLRKQFRIYDSEGRFISFSESLDVSLRQSIPLVLLSLIPLSLSFQRLSQSWPFRDPSSESPPAIDFHRNDLLIGTEDGLFWLLVPLIGVVCIGVCAFLHYALLGITYFLAVLYSLVSPRSGGSAADEQPPDSPTGPPAAAFGASSPWRRLITTAILLFLVSTFIPYQFAYLVACLVQLFTTVRALRISNSSSTAANTNYYHYTHSILVLMLWVLPINLPILAVWIRNLAVHWLTPFSSHHNVLSIMPFLLLVENLTIGRMIPRVSSHLGYVTSILLFGTALCAAMIGVSHAYLLHHLVNFVAAWLVLLHSTSESWSLTGLYALLESPAEEPGKGGTSP